MSVKTEQDFEHGELVQFKAPKSGKHHAGFADYKRGDEKEGHVRVHEMIDFGNQIYVPSECILN